MNAHKMLQALALASILLLPAMAQSEEPAKKACTDEVGKDECCRHWHSVQAWVTFDDGTVRLAPKWYIHEGHKDDPACQTRQEQPKGKESESRGSDAKGRGDTKSQSPGRGEVKAEPKGRGDQPKGRGDAKALPGRGGEVKEPKCTGEQPKCKGGIPIEKERWRWTPR